MDGYWQIALIIIIIGILSGYVLGRLDNQIARNSITSVGFFYYVISLFRTLQGNGSQYLGGSCAGKGISGYLKIFILILISFIFIVIIKRFFKGILFSFYERTVSVFVFIHLISIMLFEMPSLFVISIQGAIALVIGVILSLVPSVTVESVSKQTFLFFLSTIIGWIMIYIINGPAELFSFNSADIPYKYIEVFPHILLFSALVLLISLLAAKYLFGEKSVKLLSVFLFAYLVSSYIQIMFLNGQMDDLQGAVQTWPIGKIIINILIWLTIIALTLLIYFKYSKSTKIYTYIAFFLITLQCLSFFSLLFTGNLNPSEDRQLNTNNIFQVSDSDNIIVFILDSYDSQMVSYVETEDPDFYNRLNDFTYYNNMRSRFNYTDGSLPYLMTAKLVNGYSTSDYENSSFISTIADYGYKIQAFTDKKYIQYLPGNPISNFTSDCHSVLEHGMVVSQMINCTRYKSYPFALKSYFNYLDWNFTNCINDTNVYLFNTDSKFYFSLIDKKLDVTTDGTPVMNIYHLYGAHNPYPLQEDMTYDYKNQDPVQQWKSSMSIVYEYIDQMKANGIYDNSTIIMADHGPNSSMRPVLRNDFGINFSDDLDPIFFIKKPGEQHDVLIRNNTPVSHDDYFGTIIKSIDNSNNTFGNAIWEK